MSMNNAADRGLETLQVWKDSMALAVEVCKNVLPLFPTEEKYALSSQLRRAVQSIPANLAEGHGRHYYQEGIHYCYISRGSLEETKSHLILAYQMGYLTDQHYSRLIAHIDSIRRQLNGYISYLKNSKRGENEPGYRTREMLDVYDIKDLGGDDEPIPHPPIDPSPVD